METDQKSANVLYRESNTSLSFKEWVAREKQKGVFMKNATLQNVIESSKEAFTEKKSNFDNKKFLGISKTAIAISVAIVTVAICVSIYQKNK